MEIKQIELQEIVKGDKPIGPTFGPELDAAGLLTLPFAWSSEGEFVYSDAMTEQNKADVQVVYEAHDPTLTAVPTTVSKRQFATQLSLDGTISHDDALQWVKTGQTPSALDDAINNIEDDAQREATEIYFSGAISMERKDKEIAWLATEFYRTSKQMDDFYRRAIKL